MSIRLIIFLVYDSVLVRLLSRDMAVHVYASANQETGSTPRPVSPTNAKLSTDVNTSAKNAYSSSSSSSPPRSSPGGSTAGVTDVASSSTLGPVQSAGLSTDLLIVSVSIPLIILFLVAVALVVYCCCQARCGSDSFREKKRALPTLSEVDAGIIHDSMAIYRPTTSSFQEPVGPALISDGNIENQITTNNHNSRSVQTQTDNFSPTSPADVVVRHKTKSSGRKVLETWFIPFHKPVFPWEKRRSRPKPSNEEDVERKCHLYVNVRPANDKQNKRQGKPDEPSAPYYVNTSAMNRNYENCEVVKIPSIPKTGKAVVSRSNEELSKSIPVITFIDDLQQINDEAMFSDDTDYVDMTSKGSSKNLQMLTTGTNLSNSAPSIISKEAPVYENQEFSIAMKTKGSRTEKNLTFPGMSFA